MMGRQTADQSQLFYLLNLEEYIPADHLLRRLNPIVTGVLVSLREKLAPFYSDIGRPSIDPELMMSPAHTGCVRGSAGAVMSAPASYGPAGAGRVSHIFSGNHSFCDGHHIARVD